MYDVFGRMVLNGVIYMNNIALLSLNETDFSTDEFIEYWQNKKENKHLNKSITCKEELMKLLNKSNIKHLFVTLASGKRIEVFICGKGEPVLLVPGLGLTAPIWINQITELSLQYQVIVIHKPGHGLSETTNDLTYIGVSKVFFEVLNILGIKQPINIVGACIGGILGLALASTFPNCVGTLTVVGAMLEWKLDNISEGSFDGNKVKSLVSFLNEFDKRLDIDFDNSIKELVNSGCKTDYNEKIQKLKVKSKNIDPYSYMQFVMDFMKGSKITDFINNVKCPTLLLVGDKDSAVDTNESRKLCKIIKNAEYSEIKGAAHYPYVTHPNLFNSRIKGFWGIE
jgi:pimeloyl-ACP methyl ester carboxylesterase